MRQSPHLMKALRVATNLFVAYFNLFVRKGEKRSKKGESSYLYKLCREFREVGVRKGQEKCQISDEKWRKATIKNKLTAVLLMEAVMLVPDRWSKKSNAGGPTPQQRSRSRERTSPHA